MSIEEIENFDLPIPFKSASSKFGWPTESAFRAYRQRAKELGLEEAFVTIRRRVLVKPKTFFRLIEQHQQNQGGNHDVQTSGKASCAANGKIS